jgi:hypothetical protein
MPPRLQEEATMEAAEGLNTGDNVCLMDAAIEETRPNGFSTKTSTLALNSLA